MTYISVDKSLENITITSITTVYKYNNTNDGYDNSVIGYGYDLDYEVVILYYTIVISTLGISLNGMAMFAVGLGKNVSKKIKIQLVNMTIIDFLYALGILLSRLALFLIPVTYWDITSICVAIVTYSTLHANHIFNSFLSVERVVMIHLPLLEVKYRNAHRYAAIVFIWCLSISMSVYRCLEGWVYINYLGLISSLLVVCITPLSYISLFVTLCLRRNWLSRHRPVSQRRAIKEEKQVSDCINFFLFTYFNCIFVISQRF